MMKVAMAIRRTACHNNLALYLMFTLVIVRDHDWDCSVTVVVMRVRKVVGLVLVCGGLDKVMVICGAALEWTEAETYQSYSNAIRKRS